MHPIRHCLSQQLRQPGLHLVMVSICACDQLCILHRIQQIRLCLLIILQRDQIPYAGHGDERILKHLIIDAILQVGDNAVQHRHQHIENAGLIQRVQQEIDSLLARDLLENADQFILVEFHLSRKQVAHNRGASKSGGEHGKVIDILAAIQGEIGCNYHPTKAGPGQTDLAVAGFLLDALHVVVELPRIIHGVQPPVIGEQIDMIRSDLFRCRTDHGGFPGHIAFVVHKFRILRHGFRIALHRDIMAAAPIRLTAQGFKKIIQNRQHSVSQLVIILCDGKARHRPRYFANQLQNGLCIWRQGAGFLRRTLVYNQGPGIHPPHQNKRRGAATAAIARGKSRPGAPQQHRQAQKQAQNPFAQLIHENTPSLFFTDTDSHRAVHCHAPLHCEAGQLR